MKTVDYNPNSVSNIRNILSKYVKVPKGDYLSYEDIEFMVRKLDNLISNKNCSEILSKPKLIKKPIFEDESIVSKIKEKLDDTNDFKDNIKEALELKEKNDNLILDMISSSSKKLQDIQVDLTREVLDSHKKTLFFSGDDSSKIDNLTGIHVLKDEINKNDMTRINSQEVSSVNKKTFAEIVKSLPKSNELDYVSKGIEEGFKLPLSKDFPEDLKLEFENSKSYFDRREESDLIVKDFLDCGIIEEVKDLSSCKQYIINGLVAANKPNGKVRLCINPSQWQSKYLCSEYFEINGPKMLHQRIKPNMYGSKYDLKNGFLHLSVHKDHRNLLMFKTADGRIYRFIRYIWGPTSTPTDFCKVMDVIHKYLETKDISNAYHVDDFAILGNSFTHCLNNSKFFENLIKILGFTINYEKSVTTPSKRFEFCGKVYDTENNFIRISNQTIQKIDNRLTSLSKQEKLSKKDVLSLIGMLNWINIGNDNLKKCIDSLYARLKGSKVPNIYVKWYTFNKFRDIIKDIREVVLKDLVISKIFKDNTEVIVVTDGDKNKYGYKFEDIRQIKEYPKIYNKQDSNFKEIYAVLKCFEENKGKLWYKNITLLTDSQTVELGLKRFILPNLEEWDRKNKMLLKIRSLVEKYSINLKVVKISSKLNIMDSKIQLNYIAKKK